MTVNLDVFRTAKALTWKRWTVFAPHRSDDGTLFAHTAGGIECASLPLDTYTPDSLTHAREKWAPITGNVGIVVVDPTIIEDVHEAVRAWCLGQLGRDDITFD